MAGPVGGGGYDAPVLYPPGVSTSSFADSESLDDTGKKRLFFILGYAAAAGAVLIKGLVGAVVPAVVIISYLVVMKDPKRILKMEPILGPLVFLAIALPWYLAAGSHTSSTGGGDGYLYELVIRQNFVRFFSAFNHDKPIYYFHRRVLRRFRTLFAHIPRSGGLGVQNQRRDAQRGHVPSF